MSPHRNRSRLSPGCPEALRYLLETLDLDVPTVAHLLGLSQRTIRRWTKGGNIKSPISRRGLHVLARERGWGG